MQESLQILGVCRVFQSGMQCDYNVIFVNSSLGFVFSHRFFKLKLNILSMLMVKIFHLHFFTMLKVVTLQGRTCATDVTISTMSLLTGLHMNQVVGCACCIIIFLGIFCPFYILNHL